MKVLKRPGPVRAFTLVFLVVALLVSALHYYYSSGEDSGPQTSTILLPQGYKLELSTNDVYILKVEFLVFNESHAVRILSAILGQDVKPSKIKPYAAEIRYFEKHSTGLIDFELDANGQLRFYHVIYNYTKFTGDFDEASMSRRASKILDYILNVYKEAGFTVHGWKFTLNKITPDIVVFGNMSTGNTSKRYGIISVIFNAYYRGLGVHGLYRIDFFPDGDIAALFFDLWNVKPVKKLKVSQLLRVEDALRRHVSPSLLSRLASSNVINITEVELAYVPLSFTNGTTYLIPMYIIKFKDYHGTVRVPAVEDETLYSLVKAYFDSATETATTTSTSLECKPPTVNDVAKIVVKTRDKTMILYPSQDPGLAEKILGNVLAVIENKFANPLRCVMTREDIERELTTREHVHIVFKSPAKLRLRNVEGVECLEVIELYLTPLPSQATEVKKYVLYVKAPSESYWGCYWLQDFYTITP